MKKGYFDIKRDTATVKAGGFFCQACLVGRSAGEQSPDKRYCQGCYDFLQDGRKAVELSKDYWAPDGAFFVCYGEKYGITKTGATVCLGTVEPHKNGKETPPSGQEGVAKIPVRAILPVEPIQAQGKGIMQQRVRRGRPKKKEGEPVHRATLWRRKKQQKLQGVLFE